MRSPKPAKNGRKAPVQRRAAATVEAIVEAAARILESRGYAGYNTNDIARVAGISVGSLYQYFANKDAITRALLLRELRSLTNDIADVLSEQSGLEALDRLIDVAVVHQLERAALGRVLEVEEARLSPDTMLTEERERLVTLVRSVFDGISTASVDMGHAADDVFAMVRGMVDSAGLAGETDTVGLSVRVKRAVFGYLMWEGSTVVAARFAT